MDDESWADRLNRSEDMEELAHLRDENKRLRTALQEIVHASRDDGLAAMCNWMRGRAWAALGTENPLL